MDKVYHMIEDTAWKMRTHEVFDSFHLIALAITVIIAILLAVLVVRYISGNDKLSQAKHSRSNELQNDSKLVAILSGAGWFLVVIEIYKQLFVYHVIGNDSYDWWYFPFQLCSVPMYLCVLLPFTRGRLREAFLSFMGTFTLVSAVAALSFPEDFLRPYVMLTLHGFMWHGILLFIALVIIAAHPMTLRSFAYATLLFIVLSLISMFFNAVTGAYMFYMNPHHISPQPLVSTVQQRAGIPMGLGLYMGAIILAAFITSAIGCRLYRNTMKNREF